MKREYVKFVPSICFCPICGRKLNVVPYYGSVDFHFSCSHEREFLLGQEGWINIPAEKNKYDFHTGALNAL